MIEYKKVPEKGYDVLVKRTQVFDCGYLIVWDMGFESFFDKKYIGTFDLWLEVRKDEVFKHCK